MTKEEWDMQKKNANDEADRRFLKLVEVTPGWFELRNSCNERVYPTPGIDPCGVSLARIRGYYHLNACP